MTRSPARRLLPLAGALLAATALCLCAARLRPAAPTPAPAGADWPMFGGSADRNFANKAEKNIALAWSIKKNKEQNVKWKAQLGSVSYGGVVVAGGRVFVGANNDNPRDPKITGDKGVLMCFDEASGKFLWQIVHDKLDNTAMDHPYIGVVSTPCVDGDRLYYVSNRCELVCADAAGYAASEADRAGEGTVVWSLDMIKDLKVSPGGLEGCVSSSSPLVLGDLVYVVTSNGVNQNTEKPAAPKAPSFLAVHKDSGKPAWSSNLPGDGILDLQFSSPAAAEVNGVWEVIFAGGDGWLYGFEAEKGELLWKFDCNPKKSKFKPKSGAGTRNYLLASPVVVGGKVYIGVGREPEAGPGVGHLWCIDITKKPDPKTKDLSPVNDDFDPKALANKDCGLVWHFGGFYDAKNPKPANEERDYPFGRTMSTVAVHDGLVYAAELDGFLHCLDAQTGQEYWVHDTGGGTWASPYYVDGKVYMGVDNGDLLIFAAGTKDRLLNTIECRASLTTAPVAAHGVLYVNTGAMLYAIAPGK
jgi:outer membrane protein assembly factor BamB